MVMRCSGWGTGYVLEWYTHLSQMAAHQEAMLRGLQAMAARLVVLSLALAATGAVAIAALLVALLR